MNIIAVDDMDNRGNPNQNQKNFEEEVNAAVQAGKKIGIYWTRDRNYGGRIAAAEITDDDPQPTAIAVKKGSSYELNYL